jgi:hypothetical protein
LAFFTSGSCGADAAIVADAPTVSGSGPAIKAGTVGARSAFSGSA